MSTTVTETSSVLLILRAKKSIIMSIRKAELSALPRRILSSPARS